MLEEFELLIGRKRLKKRCRPNYYRELFQVDTVIDYAMIMIDYLVLAVWNPAWEFENAVLLALVGLALLTSFGFGV